MRFASFLSTLALTSVVSVYAAGITSFGKNDHSKVLLEIEQFMLNGDNDNNSDSDRQLPFAVPSAKTGFFPQKVDHFGPTTGINGSSTFNQFYILVDEFYKPGGPIFFWIGGEGPLSDGYPRRGLVAELASKYNGLVLALEHRFYGPGGRSVPTADFSIESLKLLNAQQALEDGAEFLRRVPEFFPEYDISSVTSDKPNKTKIVAVGGSYPGNLAAWFRQKYPYLIDFAHASSAPVKAKVDFWEYSYAVDLAIPRMPPFGSTDCITGWTLAVKEFDRNLDHFIAYNKTAELQAFKDSFWYGKVRDVGDFASGVTGILAGSVQYGYKGSKINGNTTTLEAMCDGVRFPAFAKAEKATREELLEALRGLTIFGLEGEGVKGNDDEKMEEYNSDSYGKDVSYENTSKLWTQQYCREFGYFQTAVPRGKRIRPHSVYSKYVDTPYQLRVCRAVLNDPTMPLPDVRSTNSLYNGLNVKTSNILWTNGDLDPWSFLSNRETAPGKLDQDLILIELGHHCSDLRARRETDSDYVKGVYEKIYAVYDKWLK
ncbi:hypothetical protein HDV05_002003 [Chytridiales sp. JEL 0842]|nr:hypothetical protein HDV05_002003 [Chytridiales sp. JEL 0842]